MHFSYSYDNDINFICCEMKSTDNNVIALVNFDTLKMIHLYRKSKSLIRVQRQRVECNAFVIVRKYKLKIFPP